MTNTENIKYKAHNQRAPIIRLNLIRMENIDLYKVDEPSRNMARHGPEPPPYRIALRSVAVGAKKIGAEGFDMVLATAAVRCGREARDIDA